MSNYTKLPEYQDDPTSNSDQQDQSESPSVNNFTEQIKDNIFKINNGANGLERTMKHIGTEKDSMQLRDKIHETSQTTNKIVQTTTRLLHSVAEKKANKQQKIQLDLLKSQFQDAVQRFYTLQTKVADKLKAAMQLLIHNKIHKPLISLDEDSEQEGAANGDPQQVQALKEYVPISQDDLALVYERETRIRQLEADILDVNEIFRDLGTLVQAQGEIVDAIDTTVDIAAENAEAGAKELARASVYQAKARKKMCCVVFVCLVVVVVLTVIIAISFKENGLGI